MKRIAFINEKGGTGKTTLAVNTAAWLAANKKLKVLVIDMDSQGHAGKSLGLDVEGIDAGAYEILSGEADSWRDAVHTTRIKGLNIIPGNKRLAGLAQQLGTDKVDMGRLKVILEQVERSGEFSAVVMDSPPSLGPLSLNVMAAASDIIVPVQLTYLALEGCADVVDTISRVRDTFRGEYPRLGLVVATFYRRTRMAHEILDTLLKHFKSRLARTVVGYSVKIDEAQSHGLTVFEYAPNSRGAQVLHKLGAEIFRKVVKH